MYANKVKLELYICKSKDVLTEFDPAIVKMGNLSCLEYQVEKIPNANSFIVSGNEYFIPFGQTIDIADEIEKIKEALDYTHGFLKSVQGKLQNERFIASAPENIVASEKVKEADALNKINLLQEKLNSLVQ